MKWFRSACRKIKAWLSPKEGVPINKTPLEKAEDRLAELNIELNELKIRKVAIVIGHTKSRQGAETSFVSKRFQKKVSEFLYNSIASEVIPECAYEVETCIYFRNPDVGYSAQCREIAKAIKVDKCDAAVLLHCNAGGGSGLEVLVAYDSIQDKLDLILADAFVSSLELGGSQKTRHGNGIICCSPRHNGFGMLHSINAICQIPAVILEPFFFDDESDDVKRLVDNPEAYGKLIGETVKRFYK